MKPNIAILGATGAVGQEFLQILGERDFPIGTLRLLASSRSAGTKVPFRGQTLTVEEVGPKSFDGIDIALFSAGASSSREWAPVATKAGARVVDNSSAFRMDAGVPLVVPEVNPTAIGDAKVIANPNCSTIIAAVVLWPLHQLVPLRRVVVATYQAASGAGARALAELEAQTRAVLAGEPPRPEIFPVPCAFNVFSHNSAVGSDGYNVEETKLICETRKIFGDATLRIAPTCMRVPVKRAHTEVFALEFAAPMTVEAARAVLARAPGVRLVDEPAANHFPTPLEASGADDVLVGRLRCDPSVPDGRGLQLMCAGDQLRKGAALNAVQIAELLL